jgi:hypothetical protein
MQKRNETYTRSILIPAHAINFVHYQHMADFVRRGLLGCKVKIKISAKK